MEVDSGQGVASDGDCLNVSRLQLRALSDSGAVV